MHLSPTRGDRYKCGLIIEVAINRGFKTVHNCVQLMMVYISIYPYNEIITIDYDDNCLSYNECSNCSIQTVEIHLYTCGIVEYAMSHYTVW